MRPRSMHVDARETRSWWFWVRAARPRARVQRVLDSYENRKQGARDFFDNNHLQTASPVLYIFLQGNTWYWINTSQFQKKRSNLLYFFIIEKCECGNNIFRIPDCVFELPIFFHNKLIHIDIEFIMIKRRRQRTTSWNQHMFVILVRYIVSKSIHPNVLFGPPILITCSPEEIPTVIRRSATLKLSLGGGGLMHNLEGDYKCCWCHDGECYFNSVASREDS